MDMHISPTNYNCWINDPDSWIKRYVLKIRTRGEQTHAMAAGGSFDVYVKNNIIDTLDLPLAKMTWDSVEPQNLAWGQAAGRTLMDRYTGSGAFADLLLELGGAGFIRMESELRGILTGPTSLELEPVVGSLKMMVKPDLIVILKSGRLMIGDWKCNGFCSKRPFSPVPGYTKRYQGLGNFRGGVTHDDVSLGNVDGVIVDMSGCLMREARDECIQLCFGAWLSGCPVGTPFIGAIDRLVGQEFGNWSVARYRVVIGRNFQIPLFADLVRFYNLMLADQAWDTGRAAMLAMPDSTEYNWL